MGQFNGTSDGARPLPDVIEQPCGLYVPLSSFSGKYSADDYCDWVEQSNGDPVPAQIVLYVQSGPESSSAQSENSPLHADLVRAVIEDLRIQGSLFDEDRPLKQFILSGAIAHEWQESDLYRLVAAVQSSFYVNRDSLHSWCACVGKAIPDSQRLHLLRVLGFNHLRLTFADPASKDNMSEALDRAKQLGFQCTIVDARQLPSAEILVDFMGRLTQDALPDRIRMPHIPGAFSAAVDEVLNTLGYQHIGVDWYLREGDNWLQAKQRDELCWTMLGYSELCNPDVIGIGPGALSSVGSSYALNETQQASYIKMLDAQRLPIVEGIELEAADLLRREIIAMLLTSSCIRVTQLEEKWGIEFEKYFERENAKLRELERRHRLAINKKSIDIDARNRQELIEICNIFEENRGADGHATRFPPSS